MLFSLTSSMERTCEATVSPVTWRRWRRHPDVAMPDGAGLMPADLSAADRTYPASLALSHW